MTVKQQYQRARRNYLARVRNLEKAGYVIERIPVPKRPTEASIRRLSQQTSSKLRQSNPLINILTGEIEKPKGKTERRKIEKRNINNTKFVNKIKKELNVKLPDAYAVAQALPSAVDISIQKFYESIETFRPDLQSFIKERLDQLLGDNSPERRKALEKVLRENPDYIPTPTDSNAGTIEYKFAELSRILDLTLQEQNYLMESLTDQVEEE